MRSSPVTERLPIRGKVLLAAGTGNTILSGSHMRVKVTSRDEGGAARQGFCESIQAFPKRLPLHGSGGEQVYRGISGDECPVHVSTRHSDSQRPAGHQIVTGDHASLEEGRFTNRDECSLLLSTGRVFGVKDPVAFHTSRTRRCPTSALYHDHIHESLPSGTQGFLELSELQCAGVPRPTSELW